MTTLQLTDEQVELLTQALGIAENSCLQITQEIMQKIVLVRGNKAPYNEVVTYYQKIASAFAELNILIEDSEADA